MRELLSVFVLNLLIYNFCFSQIDSLSVHYIQSKFKSFEFSEAIRLSEQFLKKNENAAKENLIEVNRIRAISYYSLGEPKSSLSAFLEILRIDPAHEFDPVTTSPKIINYFEEIKSNFVRNREASLKDVEQKPDSIAVEDKNLNIQSESKSQILKSLVLPGWGQIAKGNTKKGIFIGALNLTILTATLYYIREANKREKNYLNEQNKNLIESKYNDYNSSYKIRNYLIAAYASLWILSQLDYLFLTKQKFAKKNTKASLIYIPSHNNSAIRFNLEIKF